jgi:hypothetical protein
VKERARIPEEESIGGVEEAAAEVEDALWAIGSGVGVVSESFMVEGACSIDLGQDRIGRGLHRPSNQRP